MTAAAGSAKEAGGRAQAAIIAFIAAVLIAPGLLPIGPATSSALPNATIKIDPNRASREELMLLPGVGPVLADSIIDERNARGAAGFGSTEELDRVRRIGPKTIEKLRPYLNADKQRGGAAE